jgi:hypothetical protein
VIAAVAAVVIAGALVIAVFGRSGAGGDLDPRSAKPGGARAVAQLLRHREVGVAFTTDPAVAARKAAVAGRTIVVPRPGRLTSTEIGRLAGAAALGAHLVLIAPSDQALRALGVGMHTGPRVTVRDRPARCFAPEAVTAGSAELGGATFDGTGASADCYPAGDLPTLVLATVTGSAGAPDGRLAVLGSGAFLTNKRLGSSGDAALALELLAARPAVVWLMPTGGRADAVDGGSGLLDLVPDAVLAAVVQVGIAVVVLALWRGRRLGPPVPEPLPVVVRAAETVEGRARLYLSAHAAPVAAEALRDGARTRLAGALRVERSATATATPTGAAGTGAPPAVPAAGGSPPEVADPADPAALVATVAGVTGRPAAEIRALLYGSGMADPVTPSRRRYRSADDALVRLARDLDDLEREARQA